ncbi:hypothetical protein FB45DRAFT_670811, partial [Roridomyces roridus]
FRSSTRNTRIERLWVEVGTQFARRWRGFFTRLGRLHRLDRKNPVHLWLLHRLFLPEINEDCTEFQEEWNLHPIRGPGLTSDQSPADIHFLGQLTEGVYREDPLDGIHPDAINRYYSVEGRCLRRSRDQTGAGVSADEGQEDSDREEVEEVEELENHIAADLNSNIRHAPVKVARHFSPFKNAHVEQQFLLLMESVLAEVEHAPGGYGVLSEEWEEEEYPEIEVFCPGTRGKEVTAILPRGIWYPRAVAWARSLDLL